MTRAVRGCVETGVRCLGVVAYARGPGRGGHLHAPRRRETPPPARPLRALAARPRAVELPAIRCPTARPPTPNSDM